jgi:hypothetical protein
LSYFAVNISQDLDMVFDDPQSAEEDDSFHYYIPQMEILRRSFYLTRRTYLIGESLARSEDSCFWTCCRRKRMQG